MKETNQINFGRKSNLERFYNEMPYKPEGYHVTCSPEELGWFDYNTATIYFTKYLHPHRKFFKGRVGEFYMEISDSGRIYVIIFSSESHAEEARKVAHGLDTLDNVNVELVVTK